MSFFVPFRNGSETEFAKLKEICSLSRVYADTYEERAELFYLLVNEKVKWFSQRVEETKKDFISK